MKKVIHIILTFIVGAVISAIVFSSCSAAKTADLENELFLIRQELSETKRNAETRIKILDFQIQAYKSTNQELIRRLSEKEPEEEEEPVENSKERLPEGPTNMFMGMSYRKITDKASDQYALQQECITSKWSGIRVYHDDDGEYYYCVALGTAYGIDIGDTWKVTLRNGSEFNVILAEYKHDITDPDPNDFGDPCKNYDGEDCTNVIEFVFDEDYVPREVIRAGTFSQLEQFGGLHGDGGNIVSMEYTGRVWT